MVGGIRSRRLATVITNTWEANKVGEDIKSWVCSMTIKQWRDLFGASVIELRNLLQFSRNSVKSVLVDLVKDEHSNIEVESEINDFAETDALLVPEDINDVAPIGIWVKDKLVGHILTKDQTDIQNILTSGLLVSVKFSAAAAKGKITIQMVDPNTQLEFS
jgi:hypothetical protein